MTWSVNGGRDEIKTVELVIETAPASTDWNLKDRSNRGKYLLFIHIVFLAEKKIIHIGGVYEVRVFCFRY